MDLHEGEQEEPGSDQEDALFDGEDDEQNLMDDAEDDVASQDSELQVHDPSQEMRQTEANGQ